LEILQVCHIFARLKKDKKQNLKQMYLTAAVKQELFSKHGFAKKKADTGSPE